MAVTGADPTALKTKADLAADLAKGLAYARSLGLDPAEVDPEPLNRAEVEETINTLRAQCRAVLAERKEGRRSDVEHRVIDPATCMPCLEGAPVHFDWHPT